MRSARKLSIAVVGPALLLAFASVGAPVRAMEQGGTDLGQVPSAAPTALVDAARTEDGQLMIYDSSPEELMMEVFNDFKESYPFVNTITHIRLTAGASATRMIQEFQSGAPTADVAVNSGPYVMQLNELNIIADLDWDALDVPAGMRAGNVMPQSTTYYGFAYNSDRVTAADAPETWEDLLDPKWADGKIALWNQANWAALLYRAWGEEKTSEFFNDLLAQQPRISNDVFAMTEGIAAGEDSAGITISYGVDNLSARGAPIQFVFLQPVPSDTRFAFVSAQSNRPNTARLFMRWLGTPEGTASYYKATGRTPPDDPRLSGVQTITWPPQESNDFTAIVREYSGILSR